MKNYKIQRKKRERKQETELRRNIFLEDPWGEWYGKICIKEEKVFLAFCHI